MIRKIAIKPSNREGSFAPNTLDKEKRTVQVSWGTGKAVLRTANDGMVYRESLSMDKKHVDLTRMKAGAPVLNSHRQDDLSDVVGIVESADIINGQGVATIRFADTPKADEIFRLVSTGIVNSTSIGYRVSKMRDITTDSDAFPHYLATDYQIFELSLVSSGADDTARIRSQQHSTTPLEVEIHPKSEGDDEKPATKRQGKKMDNEKAEELRALKIEKMVRSARLSNEFAEDLNERKLTIEQASNEIFKKLEEQTVTGQRSHVITESTNEDARRDGFVEALMARENPNYKVQNEAARTYMGRSLLSAMEVHMQGRRLGESDMQFATRAMTTSDLPLILSNYGEKQMRMEYQVQSPTFTAFTKPGTLRNYKNAYRLSLGDYPNLETLNEHGEVKSGSFGESKENIQLARYAKQITFTKETLVNDDLGALTDFSAKSARAARRLESSLVYTSTLLANPTMSDGRSLFDHTNHGNAAASGTAIDLTNVSAGWQAIRAQKTLDNTDYLDLIPKFLICGLAKEAEALQFVSQNLLATQVANINPLAGKLQVIIDPRITSNKWFLACDPAQIDMIELATLEAEQGPIVRVVPNLKNGNMDIICEHSVGVAALDYRGLYYNAGA